MVKLLSTLSAGSFVNAGGYKWRVVATSPKILLFAESVIGTTAFRTGSSYYYKDSILDTYLTNFYNNLPSDFKSIILQSQIDVRSSAGSIETLSRYVYAPSATELGDTTLAYTEGTAINSLINAPGRVYQSIGNSYYWTRSITKSSVGAVVSINGADGSIYSYNSDVTDRYARPMLAVSNSTYVSDTVSGNGAYDVVYNVAPTISGSDTNVGQKTTPFTYDYTVGDINSTDNLTITEKANGITIRTITNAVRGQTYTADLSSVWKQMPVNTATTLTITVSDGSLSTTRTITFTRKEDRVVAYFKQASLTPESVQPEQVLVRVIRTIATNADFKVFVCNNGLDDSPTWEDATSAVLAGEAYTFTNRMKTAENYAVNVKIQVLKNTATSFSYIKALGFSYI